MGLVALSVPVGLFSVMDQAGAGNGPRLRRVSWLAVLTYAAVLLVACWWGPAWRTIRQQRLCRSGCR